MGAYYILLGNSYLSPLVHHNSSFYGKFWAIPQPPSTNNEEYPSMFVYLNILNVLICCWNPLMFQHNITAPVPGHHLETVELADTNPSNSARHTEHQLMRTNAVPLRRHRSTQALDTCAHLPPQLHTCHVPTPPTSINNSARHRYTCV